MNDRSDTAGTPTPAGASALSARDGVQSDAVDGIVPKLVVSPRDEEETAAVIADARARNLGVVVRGGGSLLGIGNRPRTLDVVIDTSRLNRVVEHNHEDMTVTVQAGVTLAALARTLEAADQRLAVDAFDPSLSTVGGVVAANATGGLAYGFGMPRDLVLGMTVVDGGARILRLGGRVVKNVAGYDLVRLFSGSYGTLGVITQLTLRTHPLPAASTTLIVPLSDGASLEKARAALFHSELPLAACDVEMERSLPQPSRRLVLRLEGTRTEVAYQLERCAALCSARGVETSDGWRSPFGDDGRDELVLCCGALPDRSIALIERLYADASFVKRLAARLGDGAVRVFARSNGGSEGIAFVDAVRRLAASHGASAVIERAPAAVKAAGDAWGKPPAGFELMRQLKQRFDPSNVLAPGRFVGGL